MSKSLFILVVLLAARVAVSGQTYTVLHNFGSGTGDTGGLWVDTSISQGRGGDFFSTSPGLQTGMPAAFRIGPQGAFHLLHQWSLNSSSQPDGGLILSKDGGYYGVTLEGGTYKLGTVFRLSASGADSTLHSLAGNSDGAHAWAVIQSVEGDYYISTEGAGGSAGDPCGSIFRMTEGGNWTLLHAFSGPDGCSPMILVQGTDFRFYGVTTNGGTNGLGTIFRISSTGDFQVLHNFDEANGGWPQAGLIQASDGNFYGTTSEGGTTGNGVLYRITPGGTYTVVHDFLGGQDGGEPQGRLVQASDGFLYGATPGGGDIGYGVIFRSTLDGAVTGLFQFGGAKGFDAAAQLIQGTDGKFYGGTTAGGKYNAGVFYSFDVGLAPFVSYLPAYGRAGAVVQILGQGFTSTTQVSFNGTPASAVDVVYPTFLKATVPAGATTGRITVTTSGGTLTSNKVFVIH